MPDVRVQGIRLHYEEHGSGPPILCIHGVGSGTLMWADAMPRLGELGRAIAYDRRGSGRSERPDPYETTTIEEQAADAEGLLEALDAAPAIVIGRSYGGEIGLEVAHRRPELVRALVLCESGPLHLDPEAARWGEELQASIAAAEPERVGETLIELVFGEGGWPNFPAEAQALFTGNGPAIAAEVDGGFSHLPPEVLATIEHPALVVGAADSPAPLHRADDRLAAALPNAEQVQIEGDHMIDPAGAEIVAFVERVLAR